MATIATDGSNADVQAKHNLITTLDGDILTIPAGQFTWTAGVSFTKRITLQGETTITGNHTDIHPTTRVTQMTSDDETIIKDAVASRSTNGYIIKFDINGSLGDATIPCVVKGLTFQPDPSVTTTFAAEGVMRWNGTGTSPTVMRLTNCHFNFPKWAKTMKTLGWVTGVIDHNINHSNGSMFALIWTDGYLAPGMTTTLNGHGSWADYPKFGSGDFLFFEDNAFIGPQTSGGAGTGNFDSKQGARFVSRYNQWYGSKLNSHGTGAGPQRGVRAIMQYGDTTYYNPLTVPSLGSGEIRSGSCICHDNTVHGTRPTNDRFPFRMQPDRPDGGQAGPEYAPMGGQSEWDINADENLDPLLDVDGSSLPGHIFFAEQAQASSGTAGIYTVDMKVNPGWTTNQWVGYSIRNDTWQQFIGGGTPQHRTGIITANDANTLTYLTYASTDLPQLQFRLDDIAAIRKPLQGMDEPGSGKGDILVHVALGGGDFDVRNTIYTPNKSNFPHNQAERIFVWNNEYVPTNDPLEINEDNYPTIPPTAVDNLGLGYTPFEIPAAVTFYYDADKNGPTWGAYTEDYPYPHPLVSDTPVGGPRIDVPVSHDFGNVIVSVTESYDMPVNNPGDATLVVASVAYTSGYSGLTTGFNVNPGATTARTVTFGPTAQQSYPGTITVASNADSGNATMAVTGVGVPPVGGGGGHGKGKKGAIIRRT